MSAPASGERVTPATLRDLLRGLDWRQELLAALLVLAEAALVYLAAGLLLADSSATHQVVPAWLIALLLLAGWAVPHLLDEWRIWSPQYETLLGAAIVSSLLVAVKVISFPQYAIWEIGWLREAVRALAFFESDAERPVWAVVILVTYAWWRGRTRAEPSIDSAYTMLRWGTLAQAFVLVLVLVAAEDGAQVRERLSAGTLAFFVAALGAVGVARLKLEGFRTSAPLGPRWLATFVAPILTVVVVAILGAAIFSRQFLDTILWALTPIFFILSIVFQLVVLLMAVIAYIILTPIVWLIGTREPRLIIVTPTTGTGEDPSLLERTNDAPWQAPDPLRYLIAALILFALFSLLTRFLFRRRRRDRAATAEERESVLDWSDLFAGMGARVRGLFRRTPEEDDLAALRGDPRWQYTLRIRETYRKLQARGAQLGRPRRASETADEYRPGLAIATRLPADPLATITDRYRATRYSGEPASERDAAAVEQAWRDLERAAQRD